jgi:hypothetical protein
MPRELIKSQVGPYHPKVGWSADQDVQLGIEVEGQRSIFWTLFSGDDMRTRLGQQIAALNLVEYDDDLALGQAVLNTLDTVSHGGYLGLWSDLDRHGINQLIKVLRRARDSAYGKDE